MEPTEDKSSQKAHKKFSTADICRIIKLCRKNDVSELKLGEFEISFQKKIEKIVTKSNESERKLDLPMYQHVPVTTSKPVVETVEKGFGIQDQLVLRELEAAQLLIDDPVAYEEAEIDAAINPHQQRMVTVNEDERHW